MSDLISRKAIFAILHNKAFDSVRNEEKYNTLRWCMKQIEAQPTVQPQGIDKGRLIEELKKQNKHAIEIYEKSNDVEFLHYSTALETAIAIADEMPTTDGWIPVSERLPEEDCMCLITAKVFDKLEIQYVFYQKELDLFICNGKPMAWMPLPQPYKESE